MTMLPTSQGVAATTDDSPNEPLPTTSSMVTSTWFIFRFNEDRRNMQFHTSHGVSNTPRAILRQKSYNYINPLSRNMPRTKSKTRYSEWKLYNINALYSVLESSCLIFWKWKRLKVRVDGWVGAEPTVVDGDEWDGHQQSGLDNLGWNGGWWEKSQALQCQAIYTYVWLVNLFFPSQPHWCSTSYFVQNW